MAYAESAVAKDRPVSRIENDTDQLKRMVDRVENITNRVVGHARALGYFQPTPPEKSVAPTPVVTSLADALNALDRAIDTCSGSLNVFD
jgi:hypothetical protein